MGWLSALPRKTSRWLMNSTSTSTNTSDRGSTSSAEETCSSSLASRNTLNSQRRGELQNTTKFLATLIGQEAVPHLTTRSTRNQKWKLDHALLTRELKPRANTYCKNSKDPCRWQLTLTMPTASLWFHELRTSLRRLHLVRILQWLYN